MTERNETATTILNQAETLFEQKGYAAVSMREICTACNVTKPTLYYYFKDKEALFVATMLRRIEGIHRYLQPQYQAEALRERLIRFAEQLFDRVRFNVDVMMRDMENITQVEHHIALGCMFRDELHTPLLKAMQEGIASGHFKPGQPELYVKVYLSLVNSFVEQTSTIQAVQSPTAQWNKHERAVWIVDFMIDGIGIPGGSI